MKRFCLKLIFILIFILFSTTKFYSWKETTHEKELTPEAIKLFLKKNKSESGSEIKLYKNLIIQGAHDEDFPFRVVVVPNDWPTAAIIGKKVTVYLRANNHYRHAISGSVLTGAPIIGMGETDVDTLTWAKTNEHFTKDEEYGGDQWWAIKNGVFTEQELDSGNMSWQKAINRYGYSDHSKKLSYYTLGFVLHLLQDMGVTEHVHDDPHGGSGYTGFEKWVEVNWERIVPNFVPKIDTLKPKRFGPQEKIDMFFDTLAKISYSANRFYGGYNRAYESAAYSGGAEYVRALRHIIAPDSNLKKMFKVTPSEGALLLENSDLKPLPVEDGRKYKWNPFQFLNDPFSHKGGMGHWWPTHLEMSKGENDVKGFYYIELSDDLPPPLPSAERHLYPRAYLPTPLPDVDSQIQDWEVKECKPGTHLYQLIGERMFPKIIEYSAGLMEHFYEIVNHPPYVEEVKVIQESGPKYIAFWDDILLSNSQYNNQTKPITKIVKERELIITATEKLKPGLANVEVRFSEPVKEVQITWDKYIQNSFPKPGSDDKIWQAEFEIMDEVLSQDSITVSVWATDKDKHYADKGGYLDMNPRTPARRKCSVTAENGNLSYHWEKYEFGDFDSNYVLMMKKSLGLKVHVQDEKKVPIAAAQVTALPVEGEDFFRRRDSLRELILKGEASDEVREQLREMGPGTAVTDAGGNAALSLPSVGSINVQASAEGYESASKTFESDSTSQTITLTLESSRGEGDKIFFLPHYHLYDKKITFHGPKFSLFLVPKPDDPKGGTSYLSLAYVDSEDVRAARERLKKNRKKFAHLPFPQILPKMGYTIPVYPTYISELDMTVHNCNHDYVIAITCNNQTYHQHLVYDEDTHTFTRWGSGWNFGFAPGEYTAEIKVSGPQGDIAEFSVEFIVKRPSYFDPEYYRIKLKENEEYRAGEEKSASDIAAILNTRVMWINEGENLRINELPSIFEQYSQAWFRMTREYISKKEGFHEGLAGIESTCKKLSTPRAFQVFEQALSLVEQNEGRFQNIRDIIASYHYNAAHLAISGSNNVQAARKHLERYMQRRKASGENITNEAKQRKSWPKIGAGKKADTSK